MNPLLGILFHAVGGLAAGSFYLPYKKVSKWPWEVYWLIGGIFAWFIVPVLAINLVYKSPLDLLEAVPPSLMKWPYFFGMLWGIGGLSFGLSIRYLGLSLGMAVALSLTAIFGTLIPPIAEGFFPDLIYTLSGQVILMGVLAGVGAAFVIGYAGMVKEKELDQKSSGGTIVEFNYTKGIVVATISGILSACFAFGLASGKEITEIVTPLSSSELFGNSFLLAIIMVGGLTTNLIWCIYQIKRNRSIGPLLSVTWPKSVRNFILCIIAGTTWYFQFFFYGMGSSQMDKFDFASWSLHMSFIILFSNIWGWVLGEWHGSSSKTKRLLLLGLFMLILSTAVIGYGNSIEQF